MEYLGKLGTTVTINWDSICPTQLWSDQVEPNSPSPINAKNVYMSGWNIFFLYPLLGKFNNVLLDTACFWINYCKEEKEKGKGKKQTEHRSNSNCIWHGDRVEFRRSILLSLNFPKRKGKGDWFERIWIFLMGLAWSQRRKSKLLVCLLQRSAVALLITTSADHCVLCRENPERSLA